MEDESAVITITGEKKMKRHYVVSKAKKVLVEDGQDVKSGQVIYIGSDEIERQAPFDASVSVDGGILTLKGGAKAEEIVSVLPGIEILVEDLSLIHI